MGEVARSRPVRLWPGVGLVVLVWLLRFVVPPIAPDALYIGVLAAMAGGVLVPLWWLFFSRVPWSERLIALVLLIAMVALAWSLTHESIAGGMMGMMFYVFVAPCYILALVIWAAYGRNLAGAFGKWGALVALLAVACGGWDLVRTGGFSGDLDNDFAWRWLPTAEEELLAATDGETLVEAQVPFELAAPGWAGFRGSNRDGTVHNTHLADDWTDSPPELAWHRSVGPGWSSFAVRGDRVYTQEQRGEVELVSCYRLSDGEPIWIHEDHTRFWESNAGAGPRATPTLDESRLLTLGATGILNVLDAVSGDLIWRRDAAADTEMKTPYWGFSGSPVRVGDVVIAALAGRLAAYDSETGEPRWMGPDDGMSYSSPHVMTLDGVRQVVLLSAKGAIGVLPQDGSVLWRLDWPGGPIVQPAVTDDGDLLVCVNIDSGIKRLRLSQQDGAWNIEERWSSKGLKPYFNDFVLHRGHAYGFDGRILACIDLADGERVWKGGRYGNGQMLLLADQDRLVVLSERGDLALVSATPDGFHELGRIPAIDGKTWNHPVVVGDLLLVRNAEEMAAFRLATDTAGEPTL